MMEDFFRGFGHIPENEIEDIRVMTNGLIDFYLKTRARPAQLYHYTTPHGFHGILDSGCLRSTHIAFMNDAKEYLYAVELLNDVAQQHQNDDFGADGNSMVRAINYYSRRNLGDVADYPPLFVSCFTEIADDLSQWRAYGGRESGFCLGLDAEHLNAVASERNALLAHVIYDRGKHLELAEKVFQSTVALYARHAPAHRDEQDFHLWNWYVTWRAFSSRLAPLIKYPSFSVEREWRLVFMVLSPDDIAFLPRDHYVVPVAYCGLGSSERDGGALPVRSVWIGPGRFSKSLSYYSTASLLKRLELLDRVQLSVSEIPYRVT